MPVDINGACTSMLLKKEPDYLTFTALEPNSSVALNKVGDASLLTARLEYRRNNGAWQKYTWNGLNGLVINLDAVGDRVQFRAEDRNEKFSISFSDYYHFDFQVKLIASGNLSSLLNKDCNVDSVPNNSFYKAFDLSHARLIKAPALPEAKIVGNRAYQGVFLGCDLSSSATIRLPSTESGNSLFAASFYGTKIQSILIPKTPHLEIRQEIYYRLVEQSDRLSDMTYLGSSWGGTNNFFEWGKGVPAGGVFHCPAELPVEFGDSRIPWGWTVDNGLTEPTEEEILNACYTYSADGMPAIQPDFKECLNREVQIDFVKHGKTYWKAGTPLPNPHRPELSEHYNVINISNAFRNFEKMTHINLTEWDTSEVAEMHDCFVFDKKLGELYLPWNTLKLRTATWTFANMSDLKVINIDMWDLSNIREDGLDFLFSATKAVTEAWARTQYDADLLNKSVEASGLTWRFQARNPDRNVPKIYVYDFTGKNEIFNSAFSKPAESVPGYPVYTDKNGNTFSFNGTNYVFSNADGTVTAVRDNPPAVKPETWEAFTSDTLLGDTVYDAQTVTIEFEDRDYLTFTAEEANSMVRLNKDISEGGDINTLTARLMFRVNDGDWQKYTWGDKESETVEPDPKLGHLVVLPSIGDKVQFRAEDVNETFSVRNDRNIRSYYNFNGTGTVASTGDIMSLISSDLSVRKVGEYMYYALFKKTNFLSGLPKTENIIVSGSSFASYAEQSQFKSGIYTKIPMSDTGGESLYRLFIYSNGLVSISILGKNAVSYALNGAFIRNVKLKTIAVQFADWNADEHPTEMWVADVPAGGTFHCPAELPVIFDDSHIPYGWTVDNGLTEPTEEEILNACYDYSRATGPSDRLKSCLDSSVQSSLVVNGKTYWEFGKPLPNPHRPDISPKYTINYFRFFLYGKMRYVDISLFDFSDTIDISNMLNSNKSLEMIVFPSGEKVYRKIKKIDHFMTYCPNLKAIDLSSFSFESLETYESAFYRCDSVTEAYARSQADCDLLNDPVTQKPDTWQFVIHPDLVNVQSFTLSNAGVFNGRYDLNPTEKTPEGYPIYNNAEVYNYRMEVRKVGEQFFYAFQNILGGKTYTCKTALNNPVPTEACCGKRYLTRDFIYSDGATDYAVTITFP